MSLNIPPKIDRVIRKGDDPILRRVCAAVPPGEDVSDLVELMTRVVKKARCAVGLAAPQIGVAKRVIALNCSLPPGPVRTLIMINPVLIARSSDTDVETEMCLSYPGRSKSIRRWSSVTVEYQTVQRRTSTLHLPGFAARVAQHEIDHLDGICRVGDESPADPEEPHSSLADLSAVTATAMIAGMALPDPRKPNS